ncbi:ligand-gated sodium channel [Blomia tropicalis]|nr:ligand-gated sodium channel [Blomia tropicalis]
MYGPAPVPAVGQRTSSRTATLSRKTTRKTPFMLNTLLLNQGQRWHHTLDGIQENNPTIPIPYQHQYTYGANFNTDFNSQFDSVPRPAPIVENINKQQEQKTTRSKRNHDGAGSGGTTRPSRRLFSGCGSGTGKGLSNRILYRIRPSPHKRESSRPDLEYMPPPPSNLIRLFGETSLPGVRDIALSRSFVRRVFWVMSFFFFGFLALRDISQLVSEYYTYPITVDVRLRDSRRLQFPAVTVCNLNIVRYSALCVTNVSTIKESMIPRDLREKLCGLQPAVATAAKEQMPSSTVSSATTTQPVTAQTPSSSGGKKPPKDKSQPKSHGKKTTTTTASIRSKGTAGLNSTSSSSSSTVPITTTATSADGEGLDDINNYGMISKHKEREEKELQENLTNWLAVIYNSNEKIAKELGHQFEDFVLRCTIRSTNCTSENSFENYFTPTEGNCFTFKSQKLRKNLDRIKDETSIAGVNYGLELVLNLEISEYLTGTTQIGAIIMVQHPDEIGNSASEAIFVAPQQSTYIGLKMMNISRLPKPFPEECIDHWPSALIGRLTQNASYSQQTCLKICLQRTIHTRCKCQSAMLPQLELNSTLKICDTRRRNTRLCVEEVMFQAEEKVSTCKCPPRCQVINYDKTVSMTKWPTREDKVTFDRGKANINFQNLAKVTVYFQTMTCQEVRQEKAYTTAKLFSSLGGILGMYVGFSFLSLFEILEVFVRRFWYFVTKKRSRFRTAVHTITATLAMKRPIIKTHDDLVDVNGTHKTTRMRREPIVRQPIQPDRYMNRLNQTYHHGMI